jgi:hypothetical protein
MKQRIFTWFWRRWLAPHERVVKVIGWRTALIDGSGGKRERVTFCPLATWRERRKQRP